MKKIRFTSWVFVLILTGVLGLSACNQNQPVTPEDSSLLPQAGYAIAAFHGYYTLNGSTTQYPLGAAYMKYFNNGWRYGWGYSVNGKGYFPAIGAFSVNPHTGLPQFHMEWTDGYGDGIYTAATATIKGKITVEGKRGKFQLVRSRY